MMYWSLNTQTWSDAPTSARDAASSPRPARDRAAISGLTEPVVSLPPRPRRDERAAEALRKRRIEVQPHDPWWTVQAEALGVRVLEIARAAVGEGALRVEHVGATAVAGLHARPCVDLDLVVDDVATVSRVVSALVRAGYEAPTRPSPELCTMRLAVTDVPHVLRVCVIGSLAHRARVAVRERLRGDPRAVQRLGALKRALAARFEFSPRRYVEGRAGFLLALLAECGFSEAELRVVRALELNDSLRAAP